MILTCPACDTKYVVKDGAIPAGGRQVRCAACKNSWHQDPEEGDGAMTSAVSEQMIGGPPVANPTPPPAQSDSATVPPAAEGAAMVSDYAEPSIDDVGLDADDEPESSASFAPLTASLGALAESSLAAPSIGGRAKVDALAAARAGQASSQPAEASETAAGHDDATSSAHVAEGPSAGVEPPAERHGWDDEDQFIFSSDDERRSRRGLRVVLGLIVLIALAAAALWFLAPASLKERIGLADVSVTPLEIMLTNSDRQKLASGNELLAISGRVINPTDQEQAIPEIRASLRNRATRQLVYQWTIAPPARSLPPRASASFNSAEVDIPTGGDELTVTLGGRTS